MKTFYYYSGRFCQVKTKRTSRHGQQFIMMESVWKAVQEVVGFLQVDEIINTQSV